MEILFYINCVELSGFIFIFSKFQPSHDGKWCIEAKLMKNFAFSYQLCRLYFVTGLHPTCFRLDMDLVSPFLYSLSTVEPSLALPPLFFSTVYIVI